MKEKFKIEELDVKKLRNLRINLNNRLNSFKKGGKVKELAASHKLFGLGEADCSDLLIAVRKVEKALNS